MAERAYKETTATQKIFALKKRIRAVAGGTGAAKTDSILVWLIDYCQSSKNKVVTVVAESFPHLDLGAIRDFKSVMQANGYWDDNYWNESKHVYTFPTDSFLEFISFDKFGKAHGPRRDVLFLNEANNLPYLIVDQLITRTREVVWMDWNPSMEFYFYTEMLNRREDIDFITLNFHDNEGLSEEEKKEIEAHRSNIGWWRVYGEPVHGEYGNLAGKIYSGWQFIDEIPFEARLERYYVDFGWHDPCAIGAIYYLNGGYIVDELAYTKEMQNRQIADLLANLPKALVVADQAEPKSIEEVKSYGVSIVPCVKGPDSVRQGIKLVSDQRVSVTKRSVNVIKEYRNYQWIVNKEGITTMEPEHDFSHHMDGIRYGITSIVPLKRREEIVRNLSCSTSSKPRINPAR